MLERKQAEDRVHRIGSEIHESINIIDLVSEGTLEGDQLQVLNDRAVRLEEIVRDTQALRAKLIADGIDPLEVERTLQARELAIKGELGTEAEEFLKNEKVLRGMLK